MILEDFQKTIGVTFRDKTLLKQAFIHRSYLNESKWTKQSNERLEFLGDAVLSYLTSRYLYETYPDHPEGILTNIRSSLVKTKSLATVAIRLNLGNMLYLSRGEEDSGGRNNPSLLADTFEALLGALCLDQGLDIVNQFLQTYLFPLAADIVDKKAYIDFKSYLQEIIQEQTKISPTYRVTNSEGPDHAKTFWVEAVIGNKILSTGTGRSKQEAEQDAASNALEKMGKL